MTEELSPWGRRAKELEDAWLDEARRGLKDSYVYRYFDENRTLLYVGQTGDPKRRDYAHKKRAPWFDLVATRELRGPMTKAWALFEEFVALNLEDPLYNSAKHNGHTGPGSRHWDSAMAEKFMETAITEPELYRAELDFMGRRMDEFFRLARESVSP